MRLLVSVVNTTEAAAVRADHAEVIRIGCGGTAELESAVRETTGWPRSGVR